MSDFFLNGKSDSAYLDVAINGSGHEKAAFTLEAMDRLTARGKNDLHIIEIGPGGGSSLDAISESFEAGDQDGVALRLSLLELDGVESAGLAQSRERLGMHAQTQLVKGNAKQLSDLFPEGADIVAASAVMHEVYSYGGGYEALDRTFGHITNTLQPGGYFAYRDVLSIDRLSQHERTRHIYDREGWVRFIKLFLSHYLENAAHPYRRQDDRIVFEQDSLRVDLDDIDMTHNLSIEAPIGLLREIQRHYITLRDHVWRNGALGITPVLEGALASDWIDIKRGHKRVHFESHPHDPLLDALSEEGDEGRRIVDGDIFDATTEVLLARFLERVCEGNPASLKVWDDWLQREGSETYVYMTVNRLIGTVATQSFAASEGTKILLPIKEEDVAIVPRAYYNRFLQGQLSNPIADGKQMVLFEAVDTSDHSHENEAKVAEALNTLSRHCSREVLAEIYRPVRKVF
jgi:hypothetical protein